MSRIERILPALARAWTIWAHAAGIGVIALGIGVGLVQALSGRAAVVTASNVRVAGSGGPPFPVPRIPYRGRYSYVYDLERHEACPGEVVTTFESAEFVSPAVVTTRRPAVLEEVRAYPNVAPDNPLPDAVRPGRWRMTVSLVSHCANREWTDPIAEFEIEVTGS
ncbi:hypothetical protein Q8W71_17735 [Methylobacterium sp. NEAU 140]|uniref:hypothetical protein n=1 Tax=Methylobacterium sp. NEAU 140 TaxID=3064945 RepID=UPI002732CDD1|nr:hypothetical protein [Methylobacterium sp. NEAU 140]MDP4024470.1 hypothetical protein [Methylobacterium sp. NEAU 140]